MNKIISITKGKSNCQHCGKYITNIFTIEKNDGMRLDIGSTCVEKYDFNLRNEATQKLKIFLKAEAKQKKLLAKKEFAHTMKRNFEAKLAGCGVTGSHLIKIVEPELVDGLTTILLDSGCVATDEPLVFDAQSVANQTEVIDSFEGVEAIEPFNQEMQDAVDFLRNYEGRFDFWLSLKSQLAFKGYLSDNQIGSVMRYLAKQNNLPPAIKVDGSITVGKFMAYDLAKKAGLQSPRHFIFKVFEVLRVTDKAYMLKLQATGKPTANCSCCGIALTNDLSIALGIGPICREKWGVTNWEDLDKKLSKSIIFDTWVPKSQIKEKTGF